MKRMNTLSLIKSSSGKIISFLNLFTSCIFIFSCKKLVEISPPVYTITTNQTFADSSDASAALMGIYTNLVNQPGFYFANGSMTIFGGISSDELVPFNQGGDLDQIWNNAIQPTSNNTNYTNIWSPAYFNIYQANGVIEGLQASLTISKSVKNQLTGEAKFIRAFCHFYLANLYGDVPLVLSTEWAKTDTLHRTPVSIVYQQVIKDLIDAQQLLGNDYSITNGERVRVNKWAATALLARAYLYNKDWADAEIQSDAVISETGLYSLMTDLNEIFLKNSNEAIWQLLPNINNFPNTIQEATYFLGPYALGTDPFYYITNTLVQSFELNDNRFSSWTVNVNSSGTTYYYPYKYKYVGLNLNASLPEYYMVLRLGEQYLIRSEARAQLNKANAIDDLNLIRNRAGLSSYAGSNNKDSILNAILHERRIELFAEWGHRWFDLKRNDLATSVLSSLKPKWKSTAQLFPIPITEIQKDPNLTQNPGY